MESRAMTRLKVFVVKNSHKLKVLGEKAEKLREPNTHFVKLREILGTARGAEDTREEA
ncbi:MAG: hypothetical protein QXR19_16985 [Candidatus Jordarchaeaceae archaeon]